MVTPGAKERSYFCLFAWIVGAAFTLLKGVDRDPWGVGILDVDLITLLTGYLFLSFGRIQAGIFALGQGLLMDVFSAGPKGLFAFVHIGVFWGIYLGALLFNFQTARGQVMIVSLTVLFKNAMWEALSAFFFGNLVLSLSSLYRAAISILGSGLLAPLLYAMFDRMRGLRAGEEDAPDLEHLKEPPEMADHY